MLTHFGQSSSSDLDFEAYSAYTTNSTFDPALFTGIMVITLIILLVVVAATWRIFTKAGKPGWAAIIPIYNVVVMLEVVGRPLWWIFLLFAGIIPFFGSIIALIAGIIILHDLSKSFGKDAGYTALLLLVPLIGFPMLAWGDAKYVGPAAKGHTPPATPPPTPPVEPNMPQTPPTTPTPPAGPTTL